MKVVAALRICDLVRSGFNWGQRWMTGKLDQIAVSVKDGLKTTHC